MSIGKDICYGCGKSQEYGTMKDKTQAGLDIYCEECVQNVNERRKDK